MDVEAELLKLRAKLDAVLFILGKQAGSGSKELYATMKRVTEMRLKELRAEHRKSWSASHEAPTDQPIPFPPGGKDPAR